MSNDDSEKYFHIEKQFYLKGLAVKHKYLNLLKSFQKQDFGFHNQFNNFCNNLRENPKIINSHITIFL